MSESRKKDHIELSFTSVPESQIKMSGVSYEPLLSGHPNVESASCRFLEFDFGMPLWISSMTGGTEKAKHINHNLARACGEFRLGMGLGSCRPLLDGNDRFDDFDVKELMKGMPLFSNFGIAQCEELVDQNNVNAINDVNERLQADGLIIHVNPLQEWAQPEGDRFKRPAIETIATLCSIIDLPVIVKEVGQGMGSQSLKALLELPVAAIELAGYGGTNFSILEQRRKNSKTHDEYNPSDAFAYVGHTAEQMVGYLNVLHAEKKSDVEVIISGGIKDPLSGHILQQQLNMNSVVGMASNVLKHAMGDYEDLHRYLTEAREAFAMAQAFVKGNAP